MVDFGMYLNGMERGFKKKYQKSPSNNEMVLYMFGKYNTHPVWKNRTLYVLKNFNLK
jgi:hypothetical protein